MKLSDFEGAWRLLRRIEDAFSGQDGQFEGTALFQLGAEGLRYHEVGEMRFAAGPPLRAERSYLWREGPGGVDVYFEDGRFFHHIGPGLHPKDRHFCDPDIYDVLYDFSGWPNWSARWTVQGPRKDYVMVSDFRR